MNLSPLVAPTHRNAANLGWFAVCWVWGFPLWLSSLLLATALRIARQQVRSPLNACWIVQGAWTDRLLRGWPLGQLNGMAVGYCILVKQNTTLHTVRHELMHVRQAQRWGVLFPLAYVAASVYAVTRGGHAYWDNTFEREAREHESVKPRLVVSPPNRT